MSNERERSAPPDIRPTPPQDPASPRPEGPPPAELTPLRRAERIYRELKTLLRDLVRLRAGSEGPPRELKVDLTLQVRPYEEEAASGDVPRERQFAQGLLARVGQALESELGRSAPFPAGRVRCYWCNSFECEHAAPPGPRAVFGGYSPTGVPLWPDLAGMALERRDPRIDDLYREVPIPLTILQAGSALVSEQLPVYGQRSGIYRILGQVAVGYLSLPIGPGRERASVALTLQAVEVDRGGPRLHLNILGRLTDGTDLGRLLEEEPESRLADALRVARQHLAEVRSRGRRRGRESREHQAMAILSRLARNLDRIFRQEGRRTKHARHRHQDRERPAAAALRDAISARADEIYRDVRESTWVVLGPRSRVHIFNDAGKHITSVVYPGETVRRRTAQGMWRSAAPDSVRGFREAVERSARVAPGAG